MLYSGEISATRCNNCVFYSQWLYSTCFGWQSHPSSGVQYTALYSWWWVRLSPETCRVKPLRIKNAIVASCWTYFTTIVMNIHVPSRRRNFWATRRLSICQKWICSLKLLMEITVVWMIFQLQLVTVILRNRLPLVLRRSHWNTTSNKWKIAIWCLILSTGNNNVI